MSDEYRAVTRAALHAACDKAIEQGVEAARFPTLVGACLAGALVAWCRAIDVPLDAALAAVRVSWGEPAEPKLNTKGGTS